MKPLTLWQKLGLSVIALVFFIAFVSECWMLNAFGALISGVVFAYCVTMLKLGKM